MLTRQWTYYSVSVISDVNKTMDLLTRQWTYYSMIRDVKQDSGLITQH
jgi:hypothetical protein